ncbi:hypothetical protein EIQ28_08615 [Xanthomonas campestris pv. plantaginis]
MAVWRGPAVDAVRLLERQLHRPVAVSGDQSGHNDHSQGRTRAGPGRLLPRRRSSFGSPSRAEKWLILSHMHLDCAGGTSALLQHLPNARMFVEQSPRAAS